MRACLMDIWDRGGILLNLYRVPYLISYDILEHFINNRHALKTIKTPLEIDKNLDAL